jgi:2-polyprenyl-3-methyl-5-hydroxy-6-metoxy-1,4-benzoquinol methylase
MLKLVGEEAVRVVKMQGWSKCREIRYLVDWSQTWIDPSISTYPFHATRHGWMDYIMRRAVELMEMDVRSLHFHGVDAWMMDVEWIASLRIGI